jgi:pimeloyl-ACP methyl ester carboxylesterase|tara:strand:+ start:1001 stop:1843 length:843 start_codon:yes stop_codon:yes gene_type:complete
VETLFVETLSNQLSQAYWIRVVTLMCLVLFPGTGFAEPKFFNSAGVQIRYTDDGKGEPIVLIHGFTGSLDGWTRVGVHEKLVKEFRVIALDCRGHGESDKPHDPKKYGSEMAEDIIRLLNHLKIEKAHLVGYSMGARLTGYLLVNKPERLITVTLGGSPPRLSSADHKERAKRFISNVQEQARTADASDGQDYKALAAIPLSWEEQVVSESQLSSTTVPTIAIVGSEDPRLFGMKELKNIMPALKLVVIDGATHGGDDGALRRPEFIHTVYDFIYSHRLQ